MTALTGTNIASRIKTLFGDTAGVQVTDTIILDWINDAQREISMQHENLFQKTSTANLVAGTNSYALPADLLTLQGVQLKGSSTGVFYDLQFLSPEGVDQMYPNWQDPTDTGTPIYFFRGDAGQVVLIPTPATSVAGAIQYTYSRYTVDLVAIGNALDVPEYYHQTILEYCLMKAYEMDENWEAEDRKANYVQSTIDFNNSRDAWFGRETYPVITTTAEDYY
jgi:hypothetical protein